MDRALAEGFAGVRLTTERATALAVRPAATLRRVEERLEILTRTRPVQALCQHAQATTAGAALEHTVALHPPAVRQASFATRYDGHGLGLRGEVDPTNTDVFTTVLSARLVCTVTDQGPGFDDALAGYVPPGEASGPADAGLWLVRQSCDTVETSRSRTGSTVRLATDLPAGDPRTDTQPRAAHAEPAAVRADRARDRAQALRRSLIGHEQDTPERQQRQVESAPAWPGCGTT